MSDPARILREVNDAIARGQPEACRAHLTEDFVMEDVALGRTDGPEQAVERWRTLVTAFPDVEFEVGKEVVAGDTVMQESVLRGHHLGPFLDVPPTGAQVRFRSAVIAEARQGRLAALRLYRDYAGYVSQFAFLARIAVVATVLNRALPISLIVGTTFTMISQLTKLRAGTMMTADYIRMAANYVVPFTVSTVSALTFRPPKPGKLPSGPFGRLCRARIRRRIERLAREA